jgi:hypothetical protein
MIPAIEFVDLSDGRQLAVEVCCGDEGEPLLVIYRCAADGEPAGQPALVIDLEDGPALFEAVERVCDLALTAAEEGRLVPEPET